MVARVFRALWGSETVQSHFLVSTFDNCPTDALIVLLYIHVQMPNQSAAANAAQHEHDTKPCSAETLAQTSLLRGVATTIVVEANPACNQARSRPASRRLTGGAATSIMIKHAASTGSQLRQSCRKSCWRIDSSTVTVDEPTRQRCAVHQLATQAAATRSRRGGAIKRRAKPLSFEIPAILTPGICAGRSHCAPTRQKA